MADRDLTAVQETILLSLGFIPARAIYVAAKLGIADLLAASPRAAGDLAREVDADPGALRRILGSLVAIGLLGEDAEGRFSLLPRGETLRTDSPESVRDFVILNHELPYKAFDNIMHSVKTGDSAWTETFGSPLFQHIRSDPDAAAVFHAGLRSRGRVDLPAILDAYDFSAAGRIVDVGGGTGALLSAILQRHENTSALLFDVEPVIEAARSGRGGPLPRCEFVTGDFFAGVPSGGDLYILKFVLHDWDDDDAVRVLENCREAMSDGARLLVIEGLIEGRDAPSMTDVMDLTMLVCVGGMERTEREYAALLERAGFSLTRIVATASAPFVLEARIA